MPDDLFYRDLTLRININTCGLSSKAFEVSGCVDLLKASESPPDLNKVDPYETRIEYSSHEKEGQGWIQVVRGDFFRKEVSTISHSEEMLRRFEPLFEEIERVLEETTEDGKVRTE